MKKVFFQMLLLAFALVIPVQSGAAELAESTTEYSIKAAFLYKFCLYVEWPANAFAAPNSPIVLGIAGPDSLVGLLENIVKGHTVNGRTLQVRHIDNNSAMEGMHLLFVAHSEQMNLPQLIARAKGLPLLLVTESADGLADGSNVNFAVEDNRVRFDVGLDDAEHKGLKLSAQLLKVARNVREQSR